MLKKYYEKGNTEKILSAFIFSNQNNIYMHVKSNKKK